MQAMSGVMSVTGEPGGAPVKCGVPLSDFCAGLYASYAIAAALRGVERGGAGQHIDVSMLGASLGVAALQTSEYFGTGRDPAKLGSAHPRNAPYQAFRAKDDYFAMAAGNDGLWRAACKAVGMPELADDARFTSTTLRAKHQAELKAILEAEFAKFTAEELIAKFNAAGVPCAPIQHLFESTRGSASRPHAMGAGDHASQGRQGAHLRLAAALLRQGLRHLSRSARARPAQFGSLRDLRKGGGVSELLVERRGTTLTLTLNRPRR
jgi:crotonobetainyl-CoA:carnitine CoA-transferase CaiB-like acyl-CoA transferase